MAISTPQTANTSNLSGLASRLVRDNLLSTGDAERIQAQALSTKTSFVTQLVESKKLDSATIARVASEAFGIPLFQISALDIESWLGRMFGGLVTHDGIEGDPLSQPHPAE